MKKVLIVALAATSSLAFAGFSEGFDDITTLAGSGWAQQNNSTPAGTNPVWFQGNTTVFNSHAGAANAYVAANFNSVAGNATISNWLITPVVTLDNGSILDFFTRTVDSPAFPDRLEVRMSTNGASTNVGTLNTDVGDFTTLLLTVNSGLTTSGYPNAWTNFNHVLSGLGGPTSGRLAFRYFVTSGGPSGANSDFIGLDTVSYTDAVPEPATMVVLGAAALAAAARKRRK